ncbi:MAG: UDP-N-acetylenolpyruvoylglucosamine reductase, partial [Candidatus Accumulibacter sp.]|nr:UDP-N-acetylenolpyruvoylglucosamine reductase [Accumulibacter sp.]
MRKTPELLSGFSLAAANSLALPARAALYARIGSAEQLAALAGRPGFARRRRFVLGGGSNLVLTGDFDGLVLHVAIPGRALAG